MRQPGRDQEPTSTKRCLAQKQDRREQREGRGGACSGQRCRRATVFALRSGVVASHAVLRERQAGKGLRCPCQPCAPQTTAPRNTKTQGKKNAYSHGKKPWEPN